MKKRSNRFKHRFMWDLLAKGSLDEVDKTEAFLKTCKLYGDARVGKMYFCFACQEASERSGGSLFFCTYCPIKWGEGPLGCIYNPDSPYKKWRKAKTVITKRKWAAIIRDMPWRKKK